MQITRSTGHHPSCHVIHNVLTRRIFHCNDFQNNYSTTSGSAKTKKALEGEMAPKDEM